MQHLNSDSEKTLDENLDLEHEERKLSVWKVYSSTFVCLLIIAFTFAALAWYMLDNLYSGDENEEIPVIKSDLSPIKIKPDDPGGMIVPNMDKDVYNNLIEGNNNEKPQEYVLPMPEEPLNPRIIIKNEIKPNINSIESINDIKSDTTKNNHIDNNTTSNNDVMLSDNSEELTPKNEAHNQASEQIQKNTEEVIKTVKESIQHNIPNTVTAPDIKHIPDNQTNKIMHKSSRKSTNKTGYKIQLGAFKSQKEVEIEWKKIKTRYANILGKNTHSIEKKDLGTKGIFYRLQVGPLNSETEARMICQKLSTYKQNCFVVKK
ncbi:MAG: SPOR domain-containing protein [Rickettsiales endosymbiont of Dermacentor nuttalli]